MAAHNYRYTARTSDGGIVRGSMQAADTADVLDLLRARALFVTAVNAETEIWARLRVALQRGGGSRRELLSFFRSFATLIRAGVSIQRALVVTIERTTDRRLSEALRCVQADVEHGSALSAALERRPRDFAPLHVAMIRAGETGGILDDVLERLAILLEREAALRKKVSTALAYPAVVLTAALGLTVFLIASVVPMFAQLFASFHAELPPATQMLLGSGEVLRSPEPWLAGLAVLLCAGTALWRFGITSQGALALDRVRLNVPVVGQILRKAIVARAARTLATLLRSGVELVAAIDAVAPVTGSAVYARAFARVTAGLRNGESLTQPLARARLFDPIVLALVHVGEETGQVDEMLLKVAEYFESDVEAAIATLGAVIEPALMLGLGAIVGFIVFAIFIPLYSLIGDVSK